MFEIGWNARGSFNDHLEFIKETHRTHIYCVATTRNTQFGYGWIRQKNRHKWAGPVALSQCQTDQIGTLEQINETTIIKEATNHGSNLFGIFIVWQTEWYARTLYVIFSLCTTHSISCSCNGINEPVNRRRSSQIVDAFTICSAFIRIYSMHVVYKMHHLVSMLKLA